MANPDIGITDHQCDDYSHNTYTVRFYDHHVLTTLTHDANIASDWISEIERIHHRRLNHLIVGLDVEWRPSFNRYVQYPVATLQLCVGHRCLIFQLIYASEIPSDLIAFLRNPNYTFVGIGIEQDLEKLEEDYELGFDARCVDLRSIAADVYGRNDLKNAGVKMLSSVVLSKEMDKPKRVTLSRWDYEWLTPAQVQYACLDAFLSFEIGRVLNAMADFA